MLDWLTDLIKRKEEEDTSPADLQQFQQSIIDESPTPPVVDSPPDRDTSLDMVPQFDMMGNQIEEIEDNAPWSPYLAPAMVEPKPKTAPEERVQTLKKLLKKETPAPVEKPELKPAVLDMEPEQSDSLEEAMKARNDQNNMLNYIRAFDTTARAISGAGKPIELQHLEAQNKPVEDELLKRKAGREELSDKEMIEGNDPNSQISKDLRERQALLFDQVGMKDIANRIRTSNLSYNRLQKMMGVDSNIIATERSALGEKMAAIELAKSKEEREVEKKQEKAVSFLDKSVNMLQKDKTIVAFDKLKMQTDQAAAALANPSGPGDVQTLYNFIKFLDQESAVREGEISLAQSAIPIRDRLRNYMGKYTSKSPQILGPEMRKDIVKLSHAVLEQHRKAAERKIGVQKELARKKGASDDDLYIYDQLVDTTPAAPAVSDRASKAAEEMKRRGL